jgi:hypothetical protein
MKHCLFAIALAASCLVMASASMAQSTGEARQTTFFPLGLWYEGGVGAARDHVLPEDPSEAARVYDRNFADIAAHGINLIVVPNSPPAHHKVLLDAAQKHGLKVILELGLDGGPFGHMIRGQRPMDDAAIAKELTSVLAPIKNHHALLRVQLLDEPPAGSFDRYGAIAEKVRKFSADTPPFCCLTGGSDGGAFLKASRSDVVAFDMYPLSVRTQPGDEKPLRAFETIATRFVDWAQQNDASSWAVVQCHAITGQLRFPTPAELSCMTYSALGAGNRGVFWFLYQSESVGEGVMMDGLVDRKFKSRPLWDEVGKLTREIKPLVATLATLKNPTEMKQDDPLLLARLFRDGRGRRYAMAVNLDTIHQRMVHLQYRVPPQMPGEFVFVHLPDGKKIAQLGSSNKPQNHQVGSIGFDLPAGGGALFRLDPAP